MDICTCNPGAAVVIWRNNLISFICSNMPWFFRRFLGSLSNHDERDDDDVKYARRDWDENVRMLKDDDQRISIRFAPYLAWTSLIHLSHGQSFILVAFNRAKKRSTWGFSFPYEANVPVNSKTTHSPRANPGAFDVFEKFWSNSPLCCQFSGQMPHPLELQRGSNPPPCHAKHSWNKRI